MSIRPFDWRDLPALHRNRNNNVYLNSASLLTRGSRLVSGVLLSSLASSTGIITSVSVNNGDTAEKLIGQITHAPGSQLAQLTFLMPDQSLNSHGLSPLLEHLSAQVIERGAFRVLADVDERALAFEALRRTCFAIYARQKIWKLKPAETSQSQSLIWQEVSSRDLIPVRSLYQNLVPGLVQQVEPFPEGRLHGLVYRQSQDVLAFVELKYGPRGIWAQPFVHPDAEDVANELIDLLQNLPHRRSRPIYVCVRSYQSWLEAAIEDIGAEPSPRQAVMVKHLAASQKAMRSYALPALEGGQAEVSAPIVRSQYISAQPVNSEND
jgi:hypothetical protein